MNHKFKDTENQLKHGYMNMNTWSLFKHVDYTHARSRITKRRS
jgi:hypothetical protein